MDLGDNLYQSDEDASSLPSFRRRFCGRTGRATQTKGSDAVSVNTPPAFKNSNSGLRCAMEEPMFKSVSLS